MPKSADGDPIDTGERVLESGEPAEPGEPGDPGPESDPFEPEDPDDPTTLLDPSLADPGGDPQSDPPTREPGIPPPPPAAAASPVPPSPGQVAFAAARSAIDRFVSADSQGLEIEEMGFAKAKNLAAACRDSFADHWQMNKDAALTTAANLAQASGIQADIATVASIRASLADDTEMVNAMQAWCTDRALPSPDLDQLAKTAQTILARAQDLAKTLEFKDGDISGFRKTLIGLRELLRGVVAEIGGEAGTMLAGERVPPAPRGEAVALRIARQTADGNWQDRLISKANWKGTATVVGNALREVVPKVRNPISALDASPLNGSMQTLDGALRARTLARNKASGQPIDHNTRMNVVTAYVGVVQVFESTIAPLQNALDKAGPNDPVLGMSRTEARRVLDIWLGTLRVVRDELAADPAMEDPEFAAVVRRTVSACESLNKPTSIETGIALAQKDFRAFWRSARDSEFKALKKQGVDVSALSKSFDADLGPTLDAWADQVKKFPKQDRQLVHDQTLKIEQILRQYRAQVRAAVAKEQDRSGLMLGLDTIAAGVAQTVRSYASRGGLFG